MVSVGGVVVSGRGLWLTHWGEERDWRRESVGGKRSDPDEGDEEEERHEARSRLLLLLLFRRSVVEGGS